MKSQKLIDAIFAWWNRVSALPGISSGAVGFEGMDQKTAKTVAWADESALRHKVIAMIDDVAPTLPHDDGVKLRTFSETILRQHDFDDVPPQTNEILAILKQVAPSQPHIDDDSVLSPAKIAEIFNVGLRPLQGRLNTWRKKNLISNGSYIENPDAGPRDAKYLYRVGSIRHLIHKGKKRVANV